MKHIRFVGLLAAGLTVFASHATAEGDAAKGEKLYNGIARCNSCHSLEPGVTKVGPTLAGLFGRRAGSVQGFDRYSEAMVNSGIIWDEETLNDFLANPKQYIPGNSMLAEGYYDAGKVASELNRTDIIAYLKRATAE